MRLTTTTAPDAGPGFPSQSAGSDLPALDLVRPLLGFPDYRRFALARLDETGVLCELRSLEQPDLRFVVIPPAVLFPDYAPEIDEEVAEALDASNPDDLLVLALVTLGDTPQAATANLLAPVVVNHRTRRAAQVLLEDPELPLRAPLAAR
ncbi:MAG TPA: flagellar assembly protein FliW [Nocardioidaceae bacterium]|nr:flagellar assembly protein FliW [Nocardioidaceae bacterium]